MHLVEHLQNLRPLMAEMARLLKPELAGLATAAGLQVQSAGISRNWLFAASHLLFAWLPPSRRKYTAYVNWI